MRLDTELVDLQVATIAIRQLQFPNNTLEQYFPVTEQEEVNYKLVRGNAFNQATVVRAFDAPAPIIARPGGVEIKGGLPAISAMEVITESDAIRARRLAGVENADQISANINGALARTTQAVQNKYELFRGQVICTGMIVIEENGVTQTLDFEVPTANKVTRALAWTDPTADMPDELFAWLQVFTDSAQGTPGAIMTTQRVRALMLRNEEIRKLFSPMPSVVTPAQLAAILEANELPPIVVNERKIDDGSGNLVRVISEGTLAFLPSGTLGETQTGLTEEAVNLAELGVIESDEAPGMVAMAYINDQPVYKAALTASIGLPVLQDERDIVIAQVL